MADGERSATPATPPPAAPSRVSYAEPDDAVARLFARFVVTSQYACITPADVRVVFKSVGLFPGEQDLRRIIADAAGSPTALYVDLDAFRAMRHGNRQCELNIVATFKKFADGDVLRRQAFFTAANVQQALHAEGAPPAIVDEYLAGVRAMDVDKDGRATLLDALNWHLGRVADEWVHWVFLNVSRGVDRATLVRIMVAAGFPMPRARDIVEKTITQGRRQLEPRTYFTRISAYRYVPRA